MSQFDSHKEEPKKYPCPDCRMCQGCSESRCRACRCGKRNGRGAKLSIHEQIALYDSLNSDIASDVPQEAGCVCGEKDVQDAEERRG